MKKLILASAIAALAANTASAATIYDDNGLTFKVKGDWQIQLRDNADKSSDTDVEFDDLEIKNSITYDLGNGLEAFGQVDFGFKDEANANTTTVRNADGTGTTNVSDNDNLEEAYLGLRSHGVSVLFGKTDNATDNMDIEHAYEQISESIFESVGSSSGDDVILVEADLGVATVIASHELESEGADSADGENTEIFVSAEFGPAYTGFAYQNRETSTNDTQDQDIWGLYVGYDFGVADVTVAYGESDSDDLSEDAEQFDIHAKFKVSKTTSVALGYIDLDYTTGTDVEQTYANVTYKFPAQKNVSLFAEISDIDQQGTDTETDVLAGMRIKF